MIRDDDEKILKEFGKVLKKLRISKKLSLRKLAAAADIDFMMIDDYERGRVNPTLITIRRLAEALEVDPCALVSERS